MKRACIPAAVLLFFLAVSSGLQAQAVSTACTVGKDRVTLGFGMAGTAFEGLFIDTGTVIEDYLYLGVGWNLKFGTLGEAPLQESVIRGVCALPVLTQDDIIPVSFILTAIYEKINSSGAYLDTEGLIRTGTGYEAAVDLYRDFAVGSGFTLRTVLSGVYTAGVLITEPLVGTTGTTTTERYARYLYGIKLGVLYKLEDRLVLSFAVNGHMDESFGIHYGAVFGIASAGK